MRWSPSLALALALLAPSFALVTGCDSGEAKGDAKATEDAASKAKADEDAKKAADQKALEKGLAAKKAAQEAEKAKYDAIVADTVKLPEKLPKHLDAGCTELIYIYSDWVKAIYFDDDGYQITFFDSKKENLGKVKGNCAKLGSIEAAACMVEVIKAVTAEGAYSEEQRKLIQAKPDYLFGACTAKFAPGK